MKLIKIMSRELIKGDFFHNTGTKYRNNFFNKYPSKDQLQRPSKVGILISLSLNLIIIKLILKYILSINI